MTTRLRAALLTSALAAANMACGMVPFERAPTECGFPEDTQLAFAGRSTLGRLDLTNDAPAADLPAMVYVTAVPVPFTGSIPHGADPPPDQRMYCALFDEGAEVLSAHGGVPVDWTPPGT